MQQIKPKIWLTATIASIAILFGSAPVNLVASDGLSGGKFAREAEVVAEIHVGARFLDVATTIHFERAVLRVSGPRGYALTHSVGGEHGAYITVDLLMDAEPARFGGEEERQAWQQLPDGTYFFEVSLVVESGKNRVQSGRFKVEGGSAIATTPDYSNTAQSGLVGRIAGHAVDFFFPSAHAGTTYTNFVNIVDNIDNRTQLNLCSTASCTAGGPNWRVVNNDNVFHIQEDFNSDQNRLTILPGGFVGIGTTSPTKPLHVVSASGEQLRLSSSTNNTTLDAWGNWFRIGQDNSNQFRIHRQAPPNSLALNSNGGIGIGTTNPTSPLHVRRTDGTAQILVEETSSGDATLFELSNNGHSRFIFRDTSTSNLWEFRTAGSGDFERFQINRLGSGELEFQVRKGGNAFFAGDVTANGVLLTSTREAKTDFAPLDANDVLDRLASLEISKWRYKHESEDTVHFGPVAEEFHEIFGLSNGTHLNVIDTNGISFAAIQALNSQNKQLREKNEDLMRRLERLENAIDI